MFGILKMLVGNMQRKSSARDVQQAPSKAPDEFETVYDENNELLKSLAIRKFGIPPLDAEALVHEVFLGYIKLDRERPEVRDLRMWLIGAMCNASRYYWRKHRRAIQESEGELANSQADSAMTFPESLPVGTNFDEVLAALSPRYQHILRLRYVEGYSIKEIAEDLGVTSKYTEKLVARCLRMAKERYRSLESAEVPAQHTADNRAFREVVAGFVEAYQDVG